MPRLSNLGVRLKLYFESGIWLQDQPAPKSAGNDTGLFDRLIGDRKHR